MARKQYADAKRAREPGRFVPLPAVVLNGANFASLSAHAVKLLCDLLGQYRGDNNGDLCMAWSVMQKRGWRSRDTLNKARTELLEKEWIVVTRQGGKHQASLFGLTFYRIDHCGGKLEVRATGSPSGAWRNHEPKATVIPLKTHSVTRPAGQFIDYSHDRRVNSGAAHAN